MDLLYVIACLLVLPVFIASLIIQRKVNTTFNKYSQVMSSSGMTAADAARRILDGQGLYGVHIERVGGRLTDNFNPKDNTVYLSDAVYSSASVAAIGVAAHECGHAIQHADGYIPIKMRSIIVPMVNIGSRLALPLLIVGVLIDAFSYAMGNNIGYVIICVGIAMYALSTIFALVTLPCEFNASRRAKNLLGQGILTMEETDEASEVLKQAALTYVASFAMSLIMLLRIMAIFLGGRNRRK